MRIFCVCRKKKLDDVTRNKPCSMFSGVQQLSSKWSDLHVGIYHEYGLMSCIGWIKDEYALCRCLVVVKNFFSVLLVNSVYIQYNYQELVEILGNVHKIKTFHLKC